MKEKEPEMVTLESLDEIVGKIAHLTRVFQLEFDQMIKDKAEARKRLARNKEED